ncbi:hypothetical protein M9458_004253, partial [Cirrhinus mrigala]
MLRSPRPQSPLCLGKSGTRAAGKLTKAPFFPFEESPPRASVRSQSAGHQLPRELTQPASPRALIQRGKNRSAGFRTQKESARSREKGRDRADPSLT